MSNYDNKNGAGSMTADPEEPIKLLEVNDETLPLGIRPVYFGRWHALRANDCPIVQRPDEAVAAWGFDRPLGEIASTVYHDSVRDRVPNPGPLVIFTSGLYPGHSAQYNRVTSGSRRWRKIGDTAGCRGVPNERVRELGWLIRPQTRDAEPVHFGIDLIHLLIVLVRLRLQLRLRTLAARDRKGGK